MIPASSASNKTGWSIQESLKFLQFIVGKASKEGIAAVQTRGDERVNGGIAVKIFPDPSNHI